MARSPLSSPNVKNGKQSWKVATMKDAARMLASVWDFQAVNTSDQVKICFFQTCKIPIYLSLTRSTCTRCLLQGPGGLGIPKVKSQLKSTLLLLPTICTTCSPQSHIVGDLGLIFCGWKVDPKIDNHTWQAWHWLSSQIPILLVSMRDHCNFGSRYPKLQNCPMLPLPPDIFRCCGTNHLGTKVTTDLKASYSISSFNHPL